MAGERYRYNRKGRMTGYSSSKRYFSMGELTKIALIGIAGLLVMQWLGISDREQERREENVERYRAEHCGKGSYVIDSKWPCNSDAPEPD